MATEYTEVHLTVKLVSHGENAEHVINVAWDELRDFIVEQDKSYGSTLWIEFTRNMKNGVLYRKDTR